MKTRILVLLAMVLAVRGMAADGVTVFRAGLQAFQANGAEALLGSWYLARDETAKVAQIRTQLMAMTRDLGPVEDTEVFAPHNLGRHVQRLYGVIYFQRRPLWLRAEYYSIGGRSGIVSLEFSLASDDILPLAWAQGDGGK